MANPLPNGINQPTGRTQAGIDATLGQGIQGRLPEQAYAYSQQWNFTVERALDDKSTATLAYAGSKGTHLEITNTFTFSSFNLNQLPDSYDSMGAALLTQVSNPFYGVLPAGTTLGTPTIAEGYLLLPHPQYPGGVIQIVPRYGSSTYHALQASYIRHFSHAGVLQAAYTWGKLLSDTDGTSACLDNDCGVGVVQDFTNLKAEKSVSLQDIANNLVINYGLEIPIGHGETYLSGINGLTNAFIGGWRLNGITIFRSGSPIAMIAAGNGLSMFDAGSIRPDYTAGCSKSAPGSPHSSARADKWFNTSCFTQPGFFSFGNEPRVDPELKSQGEANFDASISKFFNVTEKAKIDFSAEVFDLFNHAQFAQPNSYLFSPGFGQVVQQSNIPRTIQLALRLSF